MRLLFTFAKLVMPEGFVMPDQRAVFDAALPKLAEMRFGEFFNMNLWNDPMVTRSWPGLAAERREDLLDNAELFLRIHRRFPVEARHRLKATAPTILLAAAGLPLVIRLFSFRATQCLSLRDGSNTRSTYR